MFKKKLLILVYYHPQFPFINQKFKLNTKSCNVYVIQERKLPIDANIIK